MKIHQLTTEEALASLHSRHEGLTQAEVTNRLHEYGLNQVDVVRTESLILRFIKEFTHFFALILWLAAGLAFFAEVRQPGGGMDTLGYAVLAGSDPHQRPVFVLATVPCRTRHQCLAEAVAAIC